MKKILTLVLAASLFSVSTISAHISTGDGKTNQSQTVKTDSSVSVNDEQLLNKIANEAEEIYSQQMHGTHFQSNSQLKKSKTERNIFSGSKGKSGKKTSHR